MSGAMDPTDHVPVPRLSAYLDGELDVAHAAEIERHLASCAACRARTAPLAATRSTIGTLATPQPAPAALRARIRTIPRRHAAPSGRGWRSVGVPVAASACALAVLVSVWRSGSDTLSRELLTDHLRSLQADHLTDVRSDERHTVKPWLASRLDYAPTVPDLAPIGFPLVGGRLDYAGGRAIAALVYKRREHIINVFVLPGTGGAAPTDVTSNGFHVERAIAGGMRIGIVSDLNPDELTAFRRAFVAAF